MSKKNIPPKNYLILFGIVLLVVCACYATYNLYNIYQENKVRTSPLANKEVLYEDLKNATIEIDADTFLVISYMQNREIYNNENEIKKYLSKNNLIDNVMYLNISEYINEPNFMDDLNKTLKLGDNLKIKTFPALIYYKEGVATYKIDSTEHLLNKGDFEQIIDMYDLAS